MKGGLEASFHFLVHRQSRISCQLQDLIKALNM